MPSKKLWNCRTAPEELVQANTKIPADTKTLQSGCPDHQGIRSKREAGGQALHCGARNGKRSFVRSTIPFRSYHQSADKLAVVEYTGIDGAIQDDAMRFPSNFGRRAAASAPSNLMIFLEPRIASPESIVRRPSKHCGTNSACYSYSDSTC